MEKKILVVEDEESIRRLVRMTLAALGHEVIEAADGEEAMELVREERPDLIVLDIMLPKLDGWGVLRELRRSGLRRKTRVLLLTAKSSETDFVMGWRLGVDEYMTKPFDPDELAMVVDQTLMMSAEAIREKRLEELEKANLLSRIESAFGEGTD